MLTFLVTAYWHYLIARFDRSRTPSGLATMPSFRHGCQNPAPCTDTRRLRQGLLIPAFALRRLMERQAPAWLNLMERQTRAWLNLMECQAPAWLNRQGAKLGLGVPSCPCWQTQSVAGGFKRRLAGLWLLALLLPPGFAGAAPFAYISNSASNSVSVIDTANNTVVATAPVGTNPWGVAVNPSGTRAYVSNRDSNSVSVIATASNSVVATIPIGSSPGGVAMNPAGTRAYVAKFGSASVSVIDTASNSVVATVPVGTNPWGMAMSPTGTRAYVVNLSSDSVSVIDTASNSVVATVPVGTNPWGWR